MQLASPFSAINCSKSSPFSPLCRRASNSRTSSDATCSSAQACWVSRAVSYSTACTAGSTAIRTTASTLPMTIFAFMFSSSYRKLLSVLKRSR